MLFTFHHVFFCTHPVQYPLFLQSKHSFVMMVFIVNIQNIRSFVNKVNITTIVLVIHFSNYIFLSNFRIKT